ncbi:PD-(D/E)XK nuclease superfamily protein [Acetobacteroides hydrogenigenes]|uniref:PD-(D/E)XK nuclease superfamily protein n=2 Tax=Acetobacteroides hydrogenigenes TaxID=979970 RepID=A0A4R2E7H3_9BACT|nr:PD-(D/E)XK nuclease superfamily protein [Acetobacteroides hydrogenigenes]
MEICGYPHYENVCSNILQFYLNPNNDHGLRDLVLSSLLKLIDTDFKFDNDFEEIKVYREYKTIKDNRLDLLILTENYAVGIENKIFHHLHNDLNDYMKTVESFCYNSRKPICIVLSLNKLTSKEDIEKLKINDFINVTYEHLFKNIKHNIGKYLSNSNISYINHFTDFIKSIENLTPKTMENKVLWTFFKNNSEAIQDLTDSFIEYKNSLNQKIYQLNDTISKNEFAPLADKQWIYKEPKLLVLVHDYTIKSKYKVSIDTYIGINGWEIQLFGRNNQSTDFIFNTMCKVNDFLPKPFENYERNNRLIYERFETDVDLSVIAKSLTDLLTRVENYKKRTDENNDI